jgi:cysteine desulfurase
VHNETGVVWPLKWAEVLKQKTNALIHVDAAQAIGKVADCWSLSSELDYYSFSSHKCGGLKSHGFSFIKNTWTGEPLIIGGGQQKGMRSGTENVMGAHALQLALEELKAQFNPDTKLRLIEELRNYLDQSLEGKGVRIAQRAQHLNLTTILFVLNKLPSDLSLPLFDLQGLEVSAGAACSSGAAKANHVLAALGLGKRSKHGLRLSVGLFHDAHLQQKLLSKLGPVFAKIS